MGDNKNDLLPDPVSQLIGGLLEGTQDAKTTQEYVWIQQPVTGESDAGASTNKKRPKTRKEGEGGLTIGDIVGKKVTDEFAGIISDYEKEKTEAEEAKKEWESTRRNFWDYAAFIFPPLLLAGRKSTARKKYLREKKEADAARGLLAQVIAPAVRAAASERARAAEEARAARARYDKLLESGYDEKTAAAIAFGRMTPRSSGKEQARSAIDYLIEIGYSEDEAKSLLQKKAIGDIAGGAGKRSSSGAGGVSEDDFQTALNREQRKAEARTMGQLIAKQQMNAPADPTLRAAYYYAKLDPSQLQALQRESMKRAVQFLAAKSGVDLPIGPDGEMDLESALALLLGTKGPTKLRGFTASDLDLLAKRFFFSSLGISRPEELASLALTGAVNDLAAYDVPASPEAPTFKIFRDVTVSYLHDVLLEAGYKEKDVAELANAYRAAIFPHIVSQAGGDPLLFKVLNEQAMSYVLGGAGVDPLAITGDNGAPAIPVTGTVFDDGLINRMLSGEGGGNEESTPGGNKKKGAKD